MQSVYTGRIDTPLNQSLSTLMIYDCFSFFNELDLLELRLNILDSVVDKFVLAESNYTHSGEKKPLYFAKNRARFARFKHKIIHIVSPDPESPERARSDINYRWKCENKQRNATIQTIEKTLHDDDILIVSDLDEIPNPIAITRAIKIGRPARLRQKFYYFFLNYRCCTTPFWNTGTVVLSYKDFKNRDTYHNIDSGIALHPEENSTSTATKVRALRKIKVLNQGGWHFSYIGNLEQIIFKTQSIVEGNNRIDKKHIEYCIKTGNDIYDQGEWYFAEQPEKALPPQALSLTNFIFPVSKQYLRKVRVKRFLAHLKWLARPLAWKLIPKKIAVSISQKLKRI